MGAIEVEEELVEKGSAEGHGDSLAVIAVIGK
jgi:hypothetical protein